MSDAEVITTGLVAMLFFRGNFEAVKCSPESRPKTRQFKVAAAADFRPCR
jgi:hypothetical protein